MYRLSGLRAKPAKFLADQRGSVALILGLTLPAVIGGMALGGEAGYWYLTQTKLQQAADSSAHAAALRLDRGDTKPQLTAIAQNIATNSGVPTGSAAIEVQTPPSSGPNSGKRDYVEVSISEQLPRFLSAIFDPEPLTVRARAVATLAGGTHVCVLALSKTKANALYSKGSTSVALTDCDVASNSSSSTAINFQGNGLSFSAECAYAVGGSVQSSTNSIQLGCGAIREKALAVRDPYADLPEPTKPPGPCPAGNFSSGTIPAGSLVNGIKIKCLAGLNLSGNVQIPGGVYYIDGDMKFTGNGSLTSTGTEGVTFYVRGSIQANGNFALNLKAPTAADNPYRGVLFFGARSNTTATHKVIGTSNSVLQGALYFPSAALEYSGSSSTSMGCTQVIADTVTFSGNSGLQANCASAGTRDLVVGAHVVLVE